VAVNDELAAAEARLAELEAQRAEALLQVARLRAGLEVEEPLGHVEKIRLFGDLFRGRRDVFPQRWARRGSARSGYAPACRNEWVSGVCEKPRVRCHGHLIGVGSVPSASGQTFPVIKPGDGEAPHRSRSGRSNRRGCRSRCRPSCPERPLVAALHSEHAAAVQAG
jgi:hypothetical protein